MTEPLNVFARVAEAFGAPITNGQSYTAAPTEAKPGLNGHVASAWADHAEYLAQWAEKRLVNRDDRWGAISSRAGKLGWYKATGRLTATKLGRHFQGANPSDVIGLYSSAADHDGACWSLWLGADFDHHGEGPAPEAIWKGALDCYVILTGLGFRPILEDSNGRGGYHVWVLFNEHVETAIVRAFGRWLVSRWKEWGLTAEPEIFPKQDHITPKDCGNLLRLPGRHFKHPDHFSRIWGGSAWLEGEDAVDYLVNTLGNDPALIPSKARVFQAKPRKKISGQPRVTAQDALEQLKQDLAAIDPKLGQEFVGWTAKQLPDGQNILVGQCPFEHDSGTRNPADLSAGLHDGGGYLKCLHESCQRSREVNQRLKTLYRGESPTGINEAPDDPHKLARLHLAKFRHGDVTALRFFRGECFGWNVGAYRSIGESELQAGLAETIKVEFDRLNRIAVELWERENADSEDET